MFHQHVQTRVDRFLSSHCSKVQVSAAECILLFWASLWAFYWDFGNFVAPTLVFPLCVPVWYFGELPPTRLHWAGGYTHYVLFLCYNEDLYFWYSAEWQNREEKLSHYKAYCQILNVLAWHNQHGQKLLSVCIPLSQQWLDLLPGCTIKTNLISFKKRVRAKKTIWEISHNIRERTKLTQVQAEIGSLHQAGVLTHGPNVEVHEDGQAGEGCHSEPHQEEQVGQEHQLQTQTVCWALTMRHKWAGDGKKVPFSVLSTTVLQL